MQVLFCKSIEFVGLELELQALRVNRDKKVFPTSESFYKHLGVNRTCWWRWEKGLRAVSIEVIRKIESKLKTDLNVENH
jgi:hypothetical protein